MESILLGYIPQTEKEETIYNKIKNDMKKIKILKSIQPTKNGPLNEDLIDEFWNYGINILGIIADLGEFSMKLKLKNNVDEPLLLEFHKCVQNLANAEEKYNKNKTKN